MNKVTVICILGLFFIFCPVASSAKMQVATPPEADSSDQAKELVNAFKIAHAEKNIEAIMKLVYWKNVTDQTKEGLRKSFEGDLNKAISNVYIGPVPEDQMTEYTLGSVTYRLNLSPVGLLRVFYEKSQNGITATSYVVGIKNGKYLIATAAPVS